MGGCLNGSSEGYCEGLKESDKAITGGWRRIDFLLHSDEELSTASTCSNIENRLCT